MASSLTPLSCTRADIKHPASKSYVYLEEFGDEDGWDLQHGHRVHWLPVHHEFDSDVFGSLPRRFSSTNAEEVRGFVDSVLPNISKAALPSLRGMAAKPKGIEEVASDLFRAGLSHRSVGQTCEVLSQIKRLWEWYREAETRPTEHECVTYMVAPLLLALGWSEQQTAIEWNKIDVALFRRLPRKPENCGLVVEVKREGKGLLDAIGQARQYVSEFQIPTCRWCLATDGARYKLVPSEQREDEDLETALAINLTRVCSVDLLVKLMPRELEAFLAPCRSRFLRS